MKSKLLERRATSTYEPGKSHYSPPQTTSEQSILPHPLAYKSSALISGLEAPFFGPGLTLPPSCISAPKVPLLFPTTGPSAKLLNFLAVHSLQVPVPTLMAQPHTACPVPTVEVPLTLELLTL